jgi:hypothetical protein
VFGAASGPIGHAARPQVPTLFDRLAAQLAAASARAIGLAIDVASAADTSTARPEPTPEVQSLDPMGTMPDDARAQLLVRAWTDPAVRLTAVALDALATSLLRAGPGDAATITAARDADRLLSAVLSNRPPDSALLICGAPTYAPVRAGIPMAELAARSGAVAQGCEGSVARLLIPTATGAAARDRLLASAGVERILDRDAAASWGFATPPPGAVVVLAEPGWAFLEEGSNLPAACAGHPDAADEDEPLAMWWGEAASEPWPPRVHDYRLGTTIAHAIGVTIAGSRDRPLTG